MKRKKKKAKASDILEAYEKGERIFQNLDLRGENFNKQKLSKVALSEADFSGSDIREANFNNCILEGTTFDRVEAGIRKKTIIINFIFLCALSLVVGVFLAAISLFLTHFNINKKIESTEVIRLFIGIIIINIIIYYFHNWFAEKYYVNNGDVVEPLMIIALWVISYQPVDVDLFVRRCLFITIFILLSWQAVKLQTLITLILIVVTNNIRRFKKYICYLIFGFFSFIIALFGFEQSIRSFDLVNSDTNSKIYTINIIVILAVEISGAIIGYIIWKKDSNWLKPLAVYLTAIYGTNFTGSNLTDARFENATLNHTNFTNANLTRIYWRDVKGLKNALIQEQYLKNRKLRKLLTTGKGKDVEFNENDNLSNLNLNNTDLINAKFIGTDLHNTSFKNAILTGAIFVRTELDGVDFTSATLDDACIQRDCNITKNTIFYQAKCNNIFLEYKLEEKEYKKQVAIKFTNQKKFISYIKDFANILCFPHSRDRFKEEAIVKVISGLSEDYKESFDIVGHEIKGRNIILRIRIPDSINPQDIRNEYNPRYQQTVHLLKIESKLSLSDYEKKKVVELKNRINLDKSSHQNKFIPYSLTIMYFDQSRTNEIENSEFGDIGANAFNLGDITDSDLSNKINQLSNESDKKIQEIQNLLKQLLEKINESDISNEDKQKFSDQVSVIVEVAPEYQNNNIQKRAKQAVGFMKDIADGVKPATKLAKGFYTLLSAIGNFFM